MRLYLVLLLFFAFVACKTALKPKHFIGEYTFATGDDFIAAPDGCLFSIDSSLNLWFCPSVCGFWENPFQPTNKETLRFQINQLLESDPNTSGKYQSAEAYFADPQTAIEIRKMQTATLPLIVGKIEKDNCEFVLPFQNKLFELQPRVLQIVKNKNNLYILRMKLTLKESEGGTKIVERELKKLK